MTTHRVTKRLWKCMTAMSTGKLNRYPLTQTAHLNAVQVFTWLDRRSEIACLYRSGTGCRRHASVIMNVKLKLTFFVKLFLVNPVEILCPALPKIAFGEYEPTDCSEQKTAHGFNCTITCPFGFEVKGGPAVKICGGKRTGVWSNKNKSPKCIGMWGESFRNSFCLRLWILVLDVSPPIIECPENFTVFMESDRSYSVVKEFPQPNVTGMARSADTPCFRVYYSEF